MTSGSRSGSPRTGSVRISCRRRGRTGRSTPYEAASSADHGPARDDADVPVELARVRMLAQLDAELDGAPNDLAADRRRIGEPVRRAEHPSEHVVDRQAGRELRDPPSVDALDRHPELLLERAALRRARPGPPRSWP